MNVSAISPSISHGLTLSKIRSISVLIRNDSGNNSYDLNRGSLGGFVDSIDASYLTLIRSVSGFFQDTPFQSTSYNRGWVTIWYLP